MDNADRLMAAFDAARLAGLNDALIPPLPNEGYTAWEYSELLEWQAEGYLAGLAMRRDHS